MSIACIDELLERLESPTDSQSRQELALGLAARLMAGHWGKLPTEVHVERLSAAIAAGQTTFFCDSVGRTIGFVSWARVDPAVSHALACKGPGVLTPADWNSGAELWIIDLVVSGGHLPAVLAVLRDDVFAHDETVSYFRYKGRMRIAKQLSRHDRTQFFTSAPRLAAQADCLSPRDEVLHGRVATLTRAAELGACLSALRRAPSYMRTPLSATLRLIGESLAIRQLRVYRADNGVPTGLLAWAWLSERTVARIAHCPLHQLDIGEWNEGGILCMSHGHASETAFDAIEADINADLFPDERRLLLYVAPTQTSPAHFIGFDRATQRGAGRSWLQAGAGHA